MSRGNGRLQIDDKAPAVRCCREGCGRWPATVVVDKKHRLCQPCSQKAKEEAVSDVQD